MQTALVLSFDARQTFFGRLTHERPGMVIRAWETQEMRRAGRMDVEVRAGVVDFGSLFGGKLAVEVRPGPSDPSNPGARRAELRFDPARLAELPFARAVRDVRDATSRIVVQYQGGGGSMRLDLLSKPKDPIAFQADLRKRLVSNGITATLQLTEVSAPIEAWDPPPLILP